MEALVGGVQGVSRPGFSRQTLWRRSTLPGLYHARPLGAWRRWEQGRLALVFLDVTIPWERLHGPPVRKPRRLDPQCCYCPALPPPAAPLKVTPSCLCHVQLNIAFPSTGCQKKLEIEDDAKL